MNSEVKPSDNLTSSPVSNSVNTNQVTTKSDTPSAQQSSTTQSSKAPATAASTKKADTPKKLDSSTQEILLETFKSFNSYKNYYACYTTDVALVRPVKNNDLNFTYVSARSKAQKKVIYQ